MLIMLNCHNRPHSQLFGRFDAFFDLDRDKHEYERSLLYPKATCCVISYADISKKLGNVQLSYWQYRDVFEDENENAWVLVGMKIGELVIPKSDLGELDEFDGVIARDGDFNQFSIKSSSK